MSSEIVEQKNQTQATAAKEAQFKYRITPTHYLTYDAEKGEWELEVHLPGIAKENLKFKVLSDAYFLEATRDQAIYEVSDYFPFEINVGSVSGKYENGLLLVKGTFKDEFADAHDVKIA